MKKMRQVKADTPKISAEELLQGFQAMIVQPTDQFFKKYFIRQVPHTRCTGCYGAKFGTAPDVRAKEVANKAYFYNTNYVIHKLLAYFGIDVERVMIRAS